MHTPLLQNRLFQRLLTALTWALAVGCAVYWALSLPGGRMDGSSDTVATNALVADTQGLRRLLGAEALPVAAVAAAPQQASQLALVGVLAGADSGQGAALIAVNGQPARTVRVGHAVEGSDGLYLLSLQGRTAHLGPTVGGTSTVALELPEFKPAKAGAAPNRAPANFSAPLRSNNPPPAS